MKKLLLLLILIIAVTNSYTQNYQITRGHLPGEIYMTSIWYEPAYCQERYDAIFYSSDNGKTISMRYFNMTYTSDMPIADIISDATSGVLYNSYQKNLWISDDYGYSWDNLNCPGNWTNTFTSGCTEGEIYMHWSIGKSFLRLNKSTDYGETFLQVNNNPEGGRAEVGTEADEVYLIDAPSINHTLKILFSNNGGVDFTLQCELDSTIGGYVVYGHYPVISRGTSPGELYLATWHHPANYHIYYSTDYGQTFEQRYVSDTCNLLIRYCFTAGVESGSFYVKYTKPWVDYYGNSEMYILYSSDTAKTFTEYYHFLDENFPVSIDETPPTDKTVQLLQCYPNPFTTSTKISFSLKETENVSVDIFSINGKLVKRLISEKKEKGNHSLSWDGKDAAGKEMPAGIYLLKLFSGEENEILKILKY